MNLTTITMPPSLPTSLLTPTSLLLLPVLYILYTLTRPSSPIPTLSGPIPRISITLLYMTNMRTFLARARTALRKKQVVQFYIGPMKAYLVSGASNVATMFRASSSVSSDIFMLMIKQHIWDMPPSELARFQRDHTGRLAKPAPGTEDHPEEERYWAGMHGVMHKYLARTSETNVLARSFQRFFGERLETLPLGEAVEVGVYAFLLDNMVTAAVTAINGRRILERNPGLVKMIWEFDEIAASLVWGLPRWLNKRAYARRDRLIMAVKGYLEEAYEAFDWEGGADEEWEPVLGSRFNREWVRFLREKGFDIKTVAGGMANTTLFGANGNTTPIATWCVMEVAKDPELLREVRAEVETAYEIDPATGNKVLRGDLLTALPLLQSIYVEGLRLHVSMNVTREITGPIELSGGIVPEKGSILQAATEIVHLDEDIWGREGHPASEFWAERHIKWVDDGKGGKVRKFEMAAGPNDFFPYGGGVSVCPGRFFAKQDMMLVVAMMVSRFDIEFVKWTHRDGTPSDRPAENDVRWSGGASVPPDREMRVRMTRLW